MEAILLGQAIIADKDLYDMRHFYFDNERVGHSTCGMAFQTIMDIYRQQDIYRQHDAPSHNVGSWYGAISNSPNNIVLQYLMVYICLDTIRRDGMGMVDKALDGELGMEIFDTVPDVERLVIRDYSCWSRLYVPASFNFPNVDAVVVRVDNGRKRARIYLILVRSATSHENSETNFYQTQWEEWKLSFSSKYEVFPTFVWIDRSSFEGVQTITTGMEHERQRVHFSIGSLNKSLYNYLMAVP